MVQFVLHCLSQVRWLQLGRPAGEPPVICRYKIQQVLTSRPRMYSLVLLAKRGGSLQLLSNVVVFIAGGHLLNLYARYV